MVALAEMRSHSGLPKGRKHLYATYVEDKWNEQPENTLEELHKIWEECEALKPKRERKLVPKAPRHLKKHRWKEGER